MKRIGARFSQLQRLTPQGRNQWVQRYRQSGLPVPEFALRHGLGCSTLYRWIARDSAPIKPARKKEPILWQKIELPTPQGGTRWVVELVRPDGWTVRLAPEVSPDLLQQVLAPRPC